MKEISLFDFEKEGVKMSEARANENAPCQFNKKVLPLSFNVKNTTFSLNKFDLMNANEKLEKQRLYLLSRSFVSNHTGEIKSFLDYSFSANLSAKYYAELVNRCNVISSFQFDYISSLCF